jgi:carbon storage regulator CsrA
MLVLTRRLGESIAIGADVHGAISSVSRSRVEVAVVAPANVPITCNGDRRRDDGKARSKFDPSR